MGNEFQFSLFPETKKPKAPKFLKNQLISANNVLSDDDTFDSKNAISGTEALERISGKSLLEFSPMLLI